MKICSSDTEPYFSVSKHPRYKVVEPKGVGRNHGATMIRGWWIFDEPDGCFTTPRPTDMSCAGYATMFICLFLFWPLTCLPCCCSLSYNGYQIPIYEESTSTLPQLHNPHTIMVMTPSAPPLESTTTTIPVAVPVCVGIGAG